MGQTTNILMTGVGGQGVILASEILSEVMMQAGFDVKKSEVHGMAQRGGSVNSHVRFGAKVHSPIIPDQKVDILFSFEQLETMRYLDLIKEDAIILVNDQKILPPSVILGKDTYPDNIPALLTEKYSGFKLFDAIGVARQAGNAKALNIAFIGALSKHFDIEDKLWNNAISKILPPRLVELNLNVFAMSRENYDGGTK